MGVWEWCGIFTLSFVLKIEQWMFADGLDKKHEECVETSDSTLLARTTGRIELTFIKFFKRQDFKSFMEGIPGTQVCVCCIPDTY